MKLSRCSEIHEELGCEIKKYLASQRHEYSDPMLLDVGCWDGSTTVEYLNALGSTKGFGIEYFVDEISEAEEKGIAVEKLNIENESFPYESNQFEFIVCNQVFEHMKLIFHAYDEIVRVLKPGGTLIFSVPNLASFHNRLMLMCGIQPSSIRVFGPHVRGFTLREFINFSIYGEQMSLEKVIGVGFYPFSTTGLGKWMARMWKGGCHTPVLILKKSELVGQERISYAELVREQYQTVFE